MKQSFNIAVIPAKRISHRLPGKNVAELAGRPLWHYSLRAAQQIRGLSQVVVSSDDLGLLRDAQHLGANTHLRAGRLADPDMDTFSLLLGMIDELFGAQDRAPDLLVLLQPTHPFRNPEEIGAAIEDMEKDITVSALISGVRLSHPAGRTMNRRWLDVRSFSNAEKRNSEFFMNSGNYYILRTKDCMREPEVLGRHVAVRDLVPAELHCNIDTASDLERARALVASNPVVRAAVENLFEDRGDSR